MSSEGPALEAVGLTKWFWRRGRLFRKEKLFALAGVSFSVRAGEVVGLLGRQKSGRSTLLKILSGTLLPSSGQAFVFGAPASRMDGVRASIGIVGESAGGLSDRLSVGQELEFCAALRGMPARERRLRMEQVLARAELLGRRDERIGSLDAEQKLRLKLAQALIHDPAVLLLDDVTERLDPWQAQAIRDWIQKELIQRGRKTILMASRRPEDVAQLCGRGLLIEGGRVSVEGNPGELLARGDLP